MPCWVVYQETMESRQLDRNKPITMIRIRLESRDPAKDEVRAMPWVTKIAGQMFREKLRHAAAKFFIGGVPIRFGSRLNHASGEGAADHLSGFIESRERARSDGLNEHVADGGGLRGSGDHHAASGIRHELVQQLIFRTASDNMDHGETAAEHGLD